MWLHLVKDDLKEAGPGNLNHGAIREMEAEDTLQETSV